METHGLPDVLVESPDLPVYARTAAFDPKHACNADGTCREADNLVEDQAAYVELPEGAIVMLGCAHSRVVDALRHMRTLTDGRPLRAIRVGHASGSRGDRPQREDHKGIPRIRCATPAALPLQGIGGDGRDVARIPGKLHALHCGNDLGILT